MPGTAFAGVVLLNMAALVITGLKVAGKLEAGRKRGKIWSAWHQTLGLFGVALLPQVRPMGTSQSIQCNEDVLRCGKSRPGSQQPDMRLGCNQRSPVHNG